jgi:hypothetical protein
VTGESGFCERASELVILGRTVRRRRRKMDQVVVVLGAVGGIITAMAGMFLALAKFTDARTRAKKLASPKDKR